MKKIIIAVLILTVFCFADCKKNKPDSNGLPAATQEGKNTLGFLLNGQPWTPKGFAGTANLSLDYDATYQGGVFNISAYKILSSSPTKTQILTLFGDSIQNPGRIILPNKNKFGFSFNNDATSCRYDTFDSTTKIISGYFDIQKLDKTNGIFSGQFEIKFNNSGCETIEISQGRFDLKF